MLLSWKNIALYVEKSGGKTCFALWNLILDFTNLWIQKSSLQKVHDINSTALEKHWDHPYSCRYESDIHTNGFLILKLKNIVFW